MRGTVSRTLLMKDVFVPESELLMPHGVYFRAATSWPHMFLTLSPTYMGLAQAAYDFTVRYLRGEVPGTPPVKRRMYPTKQIAVAQMQIKLEQIKATWFQAVTEARAFTEKEALEGKMIDLIATNEEDLLQKLDGREITRFDGLRLTRLEMLQFLKEHELTHRSQLFMLMRIKGMVPPTTKRRLAAAKA